MYAIRSAVAAAVLLAGCSAGGDSAAPPAPATASGTPSVPAAAPSGAATLDPALKSPTMPLDAYSLDDDGNAALLSAYTLLVKRCMEAKGFTYAGTETTADQIGRVRDGGLGREGAFGLVDPQAAARDGYTGGQTRLRPDQLGQYSFEAQRAKHGAAYLRALYGFDDPARATESHPPGCRDEAEAQLRVPTDGVDVDVQGRLALEAAERTRNDPRVAAAFEQWSACMAQRGYRYRDPQEPFQAPWPQPRPSARELTTAKADVACKTESRLYDVWLEVERAIQQQLVAQHEHALRAVRDYYERRVRRAKEALGRA